MEIARKEKGKMTPIKFKEANKQLQKPSSMTDEQCQPLWVYTEGIECVSCWKMSLLERLKALIFGKVWLFVYSGHTQPPVYVGCYRTAFVKEKK